MQNIHLIVRLVGLLLLLPSLLKAQSIASRADELLTAYHKQDLFTGTVLMAKDGKIVFEKSYGMANREKSIPNTSKTQYRIGSISKPITALIIMDLQQKGFLSVKDSLGRYITGFPKGDSVTIENLLNHTSGIRSITSTDKYKRERGNIKSREDVLSILKEEPYVFSPGSSWQYSNSNYLLLSYIAEKVSGNSMSRLVNRIAERIGMKNTGMDYEGRRSATRAIGYEEGSMEDYIPVADNNISLLSGAGGLYSTARDLYMLDRSLYSEALINNDARQIMFTPGRGDYGYGWEIENYKGRSGQGHSGSIEGFKVQVLRYPESGTCIIFLSNYFNTRGPEICESLKAVAFDEQYKMPEVRNFIELSGEQLKTFEGEYLFKGSLVMSVKSASGRLLSIIKGQPVVGFRPLSATEFYSKSNNAIIRFEKDSNGVFSSFRLLKGKMEMEWKR